MESEATRFLFEMKPVSWGSGANGREIMQGTYEHTEAVFGGGEKEVGHEEG